MPFEGIVSENTCLDDIVLTELIIPGPPLAAPGHLTELCTLVLPSYVISLTNLYISLYYDIISLISHLSSLILVSPWFSGSPHTAHWHRTRCDGLATRLRGAAGGGGGRDRAPPSYCSCLTSTVFSLGTWTDQGLRNTISRKLIVYNHYRVQTFTRLYDQDRIAKPIMIKPNINIKVVKYLFS